MRVYLIDGTYELFRAYYGAPSSTASDGREVGASRALLRSFAAFLREPEEPKAASGDERHVTHVGVAFDTVIESFRNQLFDGYKTGEGIDPALWSQFPLAERVTRALGMTTWSMIDFEADDALATAAVSCARDARVEQVRIASPDKDLCQCVQGERIVLYDRKNQRVTNEAGVRERLGVSPAQVPALLALVGDTADGIPGIARWGEKSAAAVIDHFKRIDAIPESDAAWDVAVRGKATLARELNAARKEAALYEKLATLRYDVPIDTSLEALALQPIDRTALEALCKELGAEDVLTRIAR